MNDQPSALTSGLKWFLAGTVFGLISYPFYAVLFGPDPAQKRKRLRAA